jgi:Glypican
VVFQNLLSDPSSVSINSAYRDCLTSVRSNLNPNPFGTIPLNLGASLARSARAARQLMAGLSTAADVFHETSLWSAAPRCSESLTQLVTCAACRGNKDVAKPCHGFCMHVLEGCLTGANDIDLLWRQFVDKLVGFQQQIQRDDLESILYLMHLNISDSVLHSMETTHKYYQQVGRQISVVALHGCAVVPASNYGNR